MNEPAPVRGRHEGDACREDLQVDRLHPANVYEPREEDEGERGAVVLEEDAHVVVEEAAATEAGADVRDHEDEQRGDDRKVEWLGITQTLEDLDAFLEVDEGDVEAEDVAGEAGHVAQPVAGVCYREDPVEDEGPSGVWC